MTHTEMDELYDLYAMAALEPEFAAEIEQHLRDNCLYCTDHVREAFEFTATLAGIAESAKPSAALRGRVLATVAPPKRSRNWMFAAAALCAACLVLGAVLFGTRSELQRTRDQAQSAGNAASAEQANIAALTGERDRLRTALANANTAQQAQAAALSGERDRLRSALASETGAQRAALATLAAERLTFEAATSRNQAQVAALTGERNQLQSTLEASNNRNQAQVVSLTNEITRLRNALATANSTAQTQMASLTGEVQQLESAFAIMRRSDTLSARFGRPEAPHGWVFANRSGGLVFIGTQLPAVAGDRTLELWLVPKSGAPRPAGLFRPSDARGDVIQSSSLAVNPAEIQAVAVSDEPISGSTAPTTKPFLLVPLPTS